jgi:hypothetical protein
MIVFAQPIEQYPPHLAFSTPPTLTAGADAAYPPSRLLSYDPTQVARVNANTTQINWNFGRNRKFNVISLIGCNLGIRATWTISASTNGTTYVPIQLLSPFWAQLPEVVTSLPSNTDEDFDPRIGSHELCKSFFLSLTDLNYRYLRIDITDPDTPVMRLGRLFVGRTFRPKNSYQYGSALTFDDTGVFDRTDQGAPVADSGRRIPGASVKMSFLSTQEVYDYAYEFNYWRGSSKEILACLDIFTRERLHKNLLYCRISEGRQVTADDFEAWSQTWILESL